MDDQLFAQLEKRITEHHQHLCQRLDDLAESIHAVHDALAARQEAHEAYHQRNEHRWGLLKLAGRHPFRLALLAFTAAWLLTAASSMGSAAWIEELLKKIVGVILQ